MIETIYSNPELLHYGIPDQKWGRRRFQNEDRTWTEAGKERYGSGGPHAAKEIRDREPRDDYRHSKNKGMDPQVKAALINNGTKVAAGVAGAAAIAIGGKYCAKNLDVVAEKIGEGVARGIIGVGKGAVKTAFYTSKGVVKGTVKGVKGSFNNPGIAKEVVKEAVKK